MTGASPPLPAAGGEVAASVPGRGALCGHAFPLIVPEDLLPLARRAWQQGTPEDTLEEGCLS